MKTTTDVSTMQPQQVGYHTQGLYVQYLHRLCFSESKASGSFADFWIRWNKWCDRYADGASDRPEVWGDAFLDHELGA
jgi:hypothetical protein